MEKDEQYRRLRKESEEYAAAVEEYSQFINSIMTQERVPSEKAQHDQHTQTGLVDIDEEGVVEASESEQEEDVKGQRIKRVHTRKEGAEGLPQEGIDLFW